MQTQIDISVTSASTRLARASTPASWNTLYQLQGRRTTARVRAIAVQAILVAIFSAMGALSAAAEPAGSIKTTLPDGTTLNGNIYSSKGMIFLSAGPQNAKSSGLPDGRYYFQVTDPSGGTLLSNDPAACRQLVVIGGRVAGAYDPVTQSLEPAGSPLDASNCEHASSAPNAVTGIVPVQLGGAFQSCAIGVTSPDIFCDTPNPGGENKVWLIAQSSAVVGCNPTVNPDQLHLTFDQKCAKTDNFKLVRPAVSHVVTCKYNDANGNGILDSGELMIAGWPIAATVPAASFVTLRSDNLAGTSVTALTDSTGCVSFAASGIANNSPVTVTLTEPSQLRWTQTAPANGSYDASGKPSVSGPTSVSGAAPSSGLPASGGIISVNLSSGATLTAPNFGNTDPQCPDCSILRTVSVVNTATPGKLYTWGITKSVDKNEIDNVTPGGSAAFNYTVSVTHDNGAGSVLTGIITLINGDGSNPFTALNVADAVSDGGVCTVKDPSTGIYVPEVFNLALNSFTEISLPFRCAYSGGAVPSTGTNTVTATNMSNPSVQYTSATPYDFTKATAMVDGSATITDTLNGALGTVSSNDASPKTFSYPLSFSAGASGACTSHNNTATFTTNTTGATASASQSVQVCAAKNAVTISTTPNVTSVTLGTSPVTLRDSAILSGGLNPTGTITFTLVYQGQVVASQMVTVSGNGTYTAPGYALPATSPAAGAYQWNASYSGDAANLAASETGNAAEQVIVSKAAPGATGIPVGMREQDGALVIGEPTSLAATLSGGYNPTGTLTLSLIDADFGNVICSSTVTVNGNGLYNSSGSCVPSAFDSVEWYATYSGDANNNSFNTFIGIFYVEL